MVCMLRGSLDNWKLDTSLEVIDCNKYILLVYLLEREPEVPNLCGPWVCIE